MCLHSWSTSLRVGAVKPGLDGAVAAPKFAPLQRYGDPLPQPVLVLVVQVTGPGELPLRFGRPYKKGAALAGRMGLEDWL
eukprot:6207628-Pleurochrysis_carterae.AAC.3